MSKSINANVILFFFISIGLGLCACKNKVKNDTMKVEESIKVDQQKNLLRHVVLFNFNDSASVEIVKQIEEKFSSLPTEIPEMYSFEWGINNSPEGLDKGLTHCFLVTFLSEQDREVYLPHPKHQEFVKFIGPYVEDVTVVDYWTN